MSALLRNGWALPALLLVCGFARAEDEIQLEGLYACERKNTDGGGL